jgi:hypothetical protein
MKPDGVLVFIWNNEKSVAFTSSSSSRFSQSDSYSPFVPSHSRDEPYPQDFRALEMSLEAGTPQQHRQLWEATFDTPSYVANFKEERGDRNVVHWKSVHGDQKVRRCRLWRFTKSSRDKLNPCPIRSGRESTECCPNPTLLLDPTRKRNNWSTSSKSYRRFLTEMKNGLMNR